MGIETWTATDTDRTIARTGIEMQAEHYGLDMNDSKVRLFITHLVEVSASDAAQCRFLQNIVHEDFHNHIAKSSENK